MSDHGDRIMRHARWVLEAANHSGARGHRTWWLGSQTPFGCTMEGGRANWDDGAYAAICGLLHDRLVAEAVGEAVEHAAESERRLRGDVDMMVEEALDELCAEHERRVAAVRAELEAAEEAAHIDDACCEQCGSHVGGLRRALEILTEQGRSTG